MRRTVAPAAIAVSRMSQNDSTTQTHLVDSILKLGQPVTHLDGYVRRC